MLKHIYHVLLICSDYDRFLLEEDGRVEEALYLEYTQLGLSSAPKITHVNSPEEALIALKSSETDFQLVISMLDLGDENVEQLADDIKQFDQDMPVIVLSPSPVHRQNKQIKKSHSRSIDNFFYYQGDPNIFLAMIKLQEDLINLEHDTNEAEIQIIILVENSVRFYSSFLPLLYTCLIQQNKSSILEALNNWGKLIRMRGRPKIVLAKDYETAIGLYSHYKSHILGIITDLAYNKGGKEEGNAGLLLCKEVKKDDPSIPVLIQSMKKEIEETCHQAGASFLWKQSSTLLSDLHNYVVTNYGFGPFLFKDPKTQKVIARASTMRELQYTIATIPLNSYIYHSRRNDFSRWLRAQSLYVLAAQLKPIKVESFTDPQKAKDDLVSQIKNYRAERTKGVLAQFSRESFDETLFFSRIGNGSLGGKGRGLAFINMELRESGIMEKYPDVYLSIPRSIVISTNVFHQFIEENGLREKAMEDIDDTVMLATFLSKPINQDLKEDLRAIINIITQPLSIRSSSLLEDSHFQPFAGVYETCMIPNTGCEEKRLSDLETAVKTIWASTYFKHAKAYMKATDHMIEEEQMAVIIQQVIGSQHGNLWYPNISGVARSLNYYPIPGETPRDGIGMISFGFGKSIVDNGNVYRFSPKHPKRPAQGLGSNESSSQRGFFALNMDTNYDPLNDIDNLIYLDMKEAEKYPSSLKGCISTIDERTGMLSESPRTKGEKLLTFNSILKYDQFPLAPIVTDLLALGTQAMNTPIEIEFAINLNTEEPRKKEFSLLQIRPIAEGMEESDVLIEEDDIKNSFVYSERVMGNGKIDDISDIFVVKLDTFKQEDMAFMAHEIERFNAQFEDKSAGYLLVVAGRLGSTDPWLGIPVVWAQISHARVIVETGLPGFQVEPSEGTHFFQNLSLLGTCYLTVNPSYHHGKLDLSQLSLMKEQKQSKHFIHYKSTKPLDIRINGYKGKGIVRLKS